MEDDRGVRKGDSLNSRKANMAEECLGWTVRCPDGKLRHYPYHNEGDARFDAKHISGEKEKCWKFTDREDKSCPGGEHTVEPVAFEHK